MSQIAGILHLDGAPVSAEEAQLQLAPLSRAPHDREGAWREGPIALAHLALDIADEDALDRQPLAREGCVLVWDGRLFNRAELHGSLAGVRGLPLAQLPDSRLVLESWLRWGKECPGKLIGDFAFALWDAKERHLFLARDRMGMRPVYYARTGRLFAFASQIKGVRGLPGVDRKLDEEWVADYLSLTHLSRENTAYLGIRRLPAAHWMSVIDGRVRIERYWRLRDEPAAKFRTDEEYYDNLREVTMRAVHDRMPGRGPVGSMLSGGLDSSTVTAFACRKARAEGRRVVTVSSVLPEDHPGPEKDEREYIRAFLGMYPECEWIPVTAPGKHFLSDLDRLLEICDQPVRDAFHYVTFALCGEARRHGARTLLTGMGGDFFVSSRADGILARMVVELKWRRLWSELRKMGPTSAWKFVRSELLRPIVSASPLRPPLEWLGYLRSRSEFAGAASPRFSRKFALPERQRHLRSITSYSPWRNPVDTDERTSSSGPLASIPEYFSVLSTSSGVDVQIPLLDHRVVAGVAASPVYLRRDVGLPRSLIRKVAGPAVPPLISSRVDKGPFSPDTTRRASDACKTLGVLQGYGQIAQDHTNLLDWDEVQRVASGLRGYASGWNQDSGSIALIFSAVILLVHVGAYDMNTPASLPSPRLP